MGEAENGWAMRRDLHELNVCILWKMTTLRSKDDDWTGDMEACTSGITIELSGFLEIPTMALPFLLRQEFL
jgi:hypothetical protein